jgi:hypothetical protein
MGIVVNQKNAGWHRMLRRLAATGIPHGNRRPPVAS